MIFQKKVDRAMEWLKNKNKKDENQEDELKLEKNDLFAIIISALLVFVPLFIVLGFIIYLVK